MKGNGKKMKGNQKENERKSKEIEGKRKENERKWVRYPSTPVVFDWDRSVSERYPIGLAQYPNSVRLGWPGIRTVSDWDGPVSDWAGPIFE